MTTRKGVLFAPHLLCCCCVCVCLRGGHREMEFNGTLNGVNVTAMWAGQDRQERCACAGRAGSLSTWHVLASSTQQAALCTQPARSEKLRKKGQRRRNVREIKPQRPPGHRGERSEDAPEPHGAGSSAAHSSEAGSSNEEGKQQNNCSLAPPPLSPGCENTWEVRIKS